MKTGLFVWIDCPREGELPVLKKELAKRDIHTILVDSYQVTYRYFEELSKVCRTAYLDDLAKEDILWTF